MDIILEVRNIISEAMSEYNDGYTKKYYKDKLLKLKKLIDKALKE